MLKQLSECLRSAFQNSTYQNGLEAYLSTKSITDIAQLEYYIQQYNTKNECYL